MRIRTKIIGLLGVSFLTLIVLFSITIYWLISNYGFTDFYDRLETRTRLIARINLDHRGEKHYLEKFKHAYLDRLPNETYKIVGLDTLRIELIPDKEERNFIQGVIQKKEVRLKKGSLFRYGLLYQLPDGSRYAVETNATNTYFKHYISRLRIILIIGIACSVLVILLISWWLSKRLIRPIQQITNDIRKISSESLHVRLEASLESDELGQLIQTLNGMFDRLETSFETQNNFISNASHELNTPLTTILGEAEIVLSRERTSDEYREVLLKILSEAEKLNQKTQALLSLAQTGFNGKTVQYTQLRLDELVLEAIETVKRLQPEAYVLLDPERLPENPEILEINGNRQLLLLAMSNVILNACKYSDNQLVQIYFEWNSKQVSLVVSDQGIGIPESEMPFIYDPFFRASNTGNYKGYGIGLPLTRNIIRLHRATLHVYSEENKGTVVKMRFPHLK